ncbi:MAG: sulfotransferase domain-containing protein [Alphaproteobacteria bacterium]|nr:sulfotransferase domain-containing protein [Alphaproteobacteria bacterium]MBU1525973.1 sulfotransferase domain-containing protein [Alphaproteobacteria bacterium]MBU2118372.1 sulfotransferase domain-containing protein [Alphaproteobacteria bacterium]MBU2350381.1 sulfotransferase domain-containing protein [Alphaproteobacteria bacterium]MBU2381615.1 sulfotransferase domain-containing protein [Alphaproteobacteria bacterium]
MATLPTALIWLASYPKSGNTWMRVLLANLLAGGDRPKDINDLSEDETLISRWRFCDDLLVEPDTLDPAEQARLRATQATFTARRLTSTFLCKTHDRFDPAVLGAPAARALYLIRDPRDVAVSLSHHAGLSTDDAIGQMLDPAARSHGAMQLRYPLGDWAGHVTTWTTQTDMPLAVVRYEDLRADTPAALSRVVGALSGAATPDEIGRAVAHSSLDELQRQEASRGFRERLPGQKRFFRTGRVGEWRDVLTPAQTTRIEAVCAPVMKLWGYAPFHPGE